MKWNIDIQNLSLGGYAPAYWKSAYGGFGNKNMAISMSSTDLTDPTYITQGPGLAVITGAVDQTIKGIMNTVASADTSYGIGGNGVWEITATAVTEKTAETITGGEDITLYGNELFYSHDTDIGKADNPFASANENWWTTVASGSALTSGKPHQLIVAGTTGVLSILNGSVVANWNGTTATDDAFNTRDTDITLVSQVWNMNRFWFAGNKPNASGRNEASIFIWDGNSPSWDNRIRINGRVGALFAKNGVTYVVYQKNLSQGICTLGYVDGTQVIDLANYKGSLPAYYQITDYEDFIIWASGTDGITFAFGAGDKNINSRIFQLSECGPGGLANPFGAPISAYATSVKGFSGYETTSIWKSIQYDVTGNGKESIVDEIKFNIAKMTGTSQCDWSLVDNGGNTLTSGLISYAVNKTQTHIKAKPRCKADNFRLELDYSNGSATYPVKIKSVKIDGHTQK